MKNKAWERLGGLFSHITCEHTRLHSTNTKQSSTLRPSGNIRRAAQHQPTKGMGFVLLPIREAATAHIHIRGFFTAKLEFQTVDRLRICRVAVCCCLGEPLIAIAIGTKIDGELRTGDAERSLAASSITQNASRALNLASVLNSICEPVRS